MARVLVTYGWCRTSYVVLRSLVARDHEVYACSHLRPAMAVWSRYCKGGATVRDPFQDPKGFAQDVADLCLRWGIELVFPGHEDAIALRRFQALLPEGVLLVCPTLSELTTAVDKAAITRIALATGVEVPRTAFPSSVAEAVEAATEIGFPAVIKLRRSNGGKGVRLASDADAVRALLEGPFAGVGTDAAHFAIVQEFVEGPIAGGCALAQAGVVVAYFGERYLRTKDGGFGTSTYRERDDNLAIADSTARMLAAMNWSGLAHFDFVKEAASGRTLLLEMNPRPWGAIHLAFINGYEFPAAAVAQAMGVIDAAEFFPPQPPRAAHRSLWLIGEGIRLIGALRHRERRPRAASSGHPRTNHARTHLDGWDLRDPAPALAEALCYLWGFLKSGGELNPASAGMHAMAPPDG